MASRQRARKTGPCHRPGVGERVQLSAGAGGLPGRRDGVCGREEPSSYEAGLRAHGSNQLFHRLPGHAVARALTTAPRLTGLGPAAPGILILQGWRRKRRPGRCRVIRGLCVQGTTGGCADPPLRAFHQTLDAKRRIYRRFTSRLDSETARVVIEPQTDRHQTTLRDSLSPTQSLAVRRVGDERDRPRRRARALVPAADRLPGRLRDLAVRAA